MHHSRHRLTASMAYVTRLAYAFTNNQWACPAFPLVSSSKTKPCQFSSVFELPEVGEVEAPNCFLNFPTHCQIMYWVSVAYYMYIRFISQFLSDSDSRKIQPPPADFFTIQTLVKLHRSVSAVNCAY